MEGTGNGSGQSQHITQTICNTLWRHNLSFLLYSQGDEPVSFSNLLPGKKTLVDVYRQASLDRACYELCKLLMATNSLQSLEALLEDGSVSIHQSFSPDGVTLAHLACALILPEAVQVLQRHCGTSSNGLWSRKDVEDHTAVDVCFSQDMRRTLPRTGLFRSKVHAHLPLTPTDKDDIFQLASHPDSFYKLIVKLQTFAFDVNKVRNKEGDLLVHIAVKGDLPSLPFLCSLVNTFKADINLQDGYGLTPLCLAAQNGLETMAEVLVCVLGADVNATDGSELRWTPMHHAVQYNHPRVVSMLLRRGADAGLEDKNRCIPDLLARKNRLFECRQIIHQHMRERVELLGRQAAEGSIPVGRLYSSDVWEVTRDGYTLLMLAAMNKREELVRDLVNMPNCPLDYRQMKTSASGLVDSGSLSGSMGLNTAVISPQKSQLEPEFSLKTACHFAAERGHARCLKIMLDAGAHPSLADASAWFPLHYAVDCGHLDCVKTVLDYSNINLALCGLKPAIDIAEQNKFGKILAALRDAFDRRQREVVTPFLFEVARSGNKDLLFQILENGDDVNPINESNDWPLLLAAGFGYLDVVTQLYQFGGRVTAHHRISRATPLHVAARGGHTMVVGWLLQFCQRSSTPSPAGDEDNGRFLDINERNMAGASPLELAASQGHSSVVNLLLEHGASSTLPDSNGQLINCTAFAGTQFLIETHRKKQLDNIIVALQARVPLKTFQKIWQGPSDYNLSKQNGDTILIMAAQHAPPDVLKFLIDSARTCQPGMLVSPSGQPPPPPHHVPSSPEDSDPVSEHSLPGALPSQKPANGYNGRYSSEEERPMTALPGGRRNRDRATVGSMKRRIIQKDRQQRLAGHGHGHNGKRWDERSRPSPWKGRRSSSSNVDSSDDDVVGERSNGHVYGNGDCTVPTTGLHTRIIRQANPHDGHTALHRAALAGQQDNISVLLSLDPGCANLIDKEGNTALHLACRKQHKPTVKALLSCEHVDSSLRNQKLEYPEESSVKKAIRKMVCKHREQLMKKYGNLPSPPTSSKKDQRGVVFPASAAASVVSNPVYQSQFMGLPSVTEPLHNVSPSSTTSDLSYSAFNRRMADLKSRLRKQDEDSSGSDSDKRP